MTGWQQALLTFLTAALAPAALLLQQRYQALAADRDRTHATELRRLDAQERTREARGTAYARFLEVVDEYLLRTARRRGELQRLMRQGATSVSREKASFRLDARALSAAAAAAELQGSPALAAATRKIVSALSELAMALRDDDAGAVASADDVVTAARQTFMEAAAVDLAS